MLVCFTVLCCTTYVWHYGWRPLQEILVVVTENQTKWRAFFNDVSVCRIEAGYAMNTGSACSRRVCM